MKKLFFAICFSLVFVFPAFSRVTPVSGLEDIKPMQNNINAEPEVREVEYNEFKNFIQERFSKAKKTNSEGINKNIGYIPSPVRLKMEEDSKKGLFQQIYEQALERVNKPAEAGRSDITAKTAETPDIIQQQKEWQQPDIPVISAYLPPDNTAVSVPAMEHIPYLMTSIEVLPSGLVKFEETIVVVANGEKLRRGLTKILPETVSDTGGKQQRLDYSVIGVRVNDMPVNYHLVADNGRVLLVPSDDYILDPGIYTYKIEYVVDNLLWNDGDYYRLYWDIAGSGWNLVIDRLGASLGLPSETGLIGHEVLLGSPSGLSANAVDIRQNGRFATAYIAKRPLFIGEGMYLVANIDKTALLPPSLWQKVLRLFYDNGDIWLSLLGLIVIALSFVVSWRYISADKGQVKLSLKKTAAVMRFLLYNRFDVKSACGFLLEVYKKNIIDIQQAGDTILLIKRTDNLKSLQPYEQKALQQLFPAHETVFGVSGQNRLPFRRFMNRLAQGLRRQMLEFYLKLNSGYLLFSMGMLLVTEAFIAVFKINTLNVLLVLAGTSLVSLGVIAAWNLAVRRWLKVVLRLFLADIILLCFVLMSAVVHPLAAGFILLATGVIVYTLKVYSRRLGLIKHYIQDIEKYRDYLLRHRENILLGKDFLNDQAAIWALDLEKEFVPHGKTEYNKLSVVQDIARVILAN